MTQTLDAVMMSQDAPPETRLWQAVVATTIQEWVSGPLTAQREAERYIFSSKSDFNLVCESAGMNPDYLRGRLQRLRKQNSIPVRGVVNLKIGEEEGEVVFDSDVE